jgi:peptidoglycan/xylan/chitin deacetylase (PgdA/CDA1 family)
MILAYHEVLPHESAYLYTVTSSQLDLHLSIINGLSSMGTQGFAQAQVTFDDGHLSNYEYAVPILLKRHLPATFFVTTGWIGSRQGFMSWQQLREIASLGHAVQSHGLSHKLLTHCSPKDLLEEVHSSKKAIEDALGRRVTSISVPGGRWNSRVLRACFQSGYDEVYVSDPTLRSCTMDGVRVQGRLMVTRLMTADVIRPYLQGSSAMFFLLNGKNVCKSLSKRLLGDGIYGWLWRKMADKDKASYR